MAGAATIERMWLDATSWVDVARGWVPDADVVYEDLVGTVPWRQGRLWRYERWVDEPRLTGSARKATGGLHPALITAQRELRNRYRVDIDGPALSWYRDGNDGLAFHRDRELRWCEDTVIAIATFGGPRPFLLQSRRDEDRVVELAPASGDLIVMGGRCQADWLHAVPRQRGVVPGRMSAQWRWTSRTGRPEIGPGYRAPRNFTG